MCFMSNQMHFYEITLFNFQMSMKCLSFSMQSAFIVVKSRVKIPRNYNDCSRENFSNFSL